MKLILEYVIAFLFVIAMTFGIYAAQLNITVSNQRAEIETLRQHISAQDRVIEIMTAQYNSRVIGGQ
jgi:translation elongation factor EF-1beta